MARQTHRSRPPGPGPGRSGPAIPALPLAAPLPARCWPTCWPQSSPPFPLAALAGVSSEGPRIGVPGMRESENGSLLVVYYETFLRDHDIEHFQQQVSARYTEGTLARLIDSGDRGRAPCRHSGPGITWHHGEQRRGRPRSPRQRFDRSRPGRQRALGYLVSCRHAREQQHARAGTAPDPARSPCRCRHACLTIDRSRAQLRRSLQPAGHRPLLPGPLPGERRRLRAGPGTQSLSLRCPGRPRAVPAPARAAHARR